MTVKNALTSASPLKEGLLAWGLSHSEAEVYLYLLQKSSETGGSKIAIGTKIHRQSVYLALERLIALDLVETIPVGKQHRYKARSPLAMSHITRKRSIATEELVHELNKISAIHHDQDFEVLQGARHIQQFELDYAHESAPHEKEYIIGGYAKGFTEVMGDALEKYLAKKNEKRISVRYLGNESERAQYASVIGKYPNQEYRFLKELPQRVTHLTVRKDTVLFYSFLTPPLVYVIKSEAVARDYKDFFMMLWNLAE